MSVGLAPRPANEEQRVKAEKQAFAEVGWE